MEKHNQLRTLLVEILVTVLFFALSATILLEVFVGARNQSLRAEITNEALFAAQNLADRLYEAEDAEALLRADGFAQAGEKWTLEGGTYALTVTLTEERMTGGVLRIARVEALRDGEALLTLPCARYQAEEVAP